MLKTVQRPRGRTGMCFKNMQWVIQRQRKSSRHLNLKASVLLQKDDRTATEERDQSPTDYDRVKKYNQYLNSCEELT